MKAVNNTNERIALTIGYTFCAGLGVFALWYIYTAMCMVIPHLTCASH